MENFKSLLPLLTSMAKESTIIPLSKENHLQRCIISAATPPLALMENFKSLLPLLTSMAKESTIIPLSKENHLQRCIISTATPPINNSQ
jgi:hypothetical protein